jgi:hypothetical protein
MGGAGDYRLEKADRMRKAKFEWLLLKSKIAAHFN